MPHIRSENVSDLAAIAAVVDAAFADDPRVVGLVELLRASPGYVPLLALVADDDGDVIGHVMFTESTVEGSEATILILSPLAVRPDHHRQGIGSALVREGLRRADAHGAPLVIVEGDPRYYSRFGFRRASELGLERPHEQIPEVAFQALPLAGYDPRLRGKVVYPPPFESVTERRRTNGCGPLAARSRATSSLANCRFCRRVWRNRRMGISCSRAKRPIL